MDLNFLQTSVRSLFVSGTSEENASDAQTFAEVYVSILKPIGIENLREMVSKFSDSALNQILAKRQELYTDVLLNPLCQMCMIEWAYRHTYLDGDWFWQWDGPREGHLTYKLKEPLTQMTQIPWP
jgi:hypothetical protein